MAETDKAAAEAFERDREAVGRAENDELNRRMVAAEHGGPVAWERRPPDLQESLITAGRGAYILGFTAGHAVGFDEGHETGYEAGEEAGSERVAGERDDFLEYARALAVRLENEVARLTTERESISHAEFARFVQEAKEQRERAERAEAHAEQLTRERDEVLATLVDLYAAAVKLTNADPTHYEVANTVGLAALQAMQLIDRYRGVGAGGLSK
jgi:hypothetical protein